MREDHWQLRIRVCNLILLILGAAAGKGEPVCMMAAGSGGVRGIARLARA